MFWNWFRKHKKLHVRYVYKVGILIEEEGYHFYRGLAEKMQDEKSKALCIRLAQEEAQHKRLFEKALDEWLPLRIDNSMLQGYVARLKVAGVFSEPAASNPSLKEILEFAIAGEEKVADFYQSLENEFPEAWKQVQVHELVQAEKEHAQMLRNLLNDLPKPTPFD